MNGAYVRFEWSQMQLNIFPLYSSPVFTYISLIMFHCFHQVEEALADLESDDRISKDLEPGIEMIDDYLHEVKLVNKVI